MIRMNGDRGDPEGHHVARSCPCPCEREGPWKDQAPDAGAGRGGREACPELGLARARAEDRCRTLPGRPGRVAAVGEAYQRAFHVVNQALPRADGGARPRHEHVVMPGLGREGAERAGRPRAGVASRGCARPPRRCFLVAVKPAPISSLQPSLSADPAPERRPRAAACALRNKQKLRPLLQPAELDCFSAGASTGSRRTKASLKPAEIRPSAACGPWRGGGRRSSGRSWWPCGDGSRGDACAPNGSADRCASRCNSAPDAVLSRGRERLEVSVEMSARGYG